MDSWPIPAHWLTADVRQTTVDGKGRMWGEKAGISKLTPQAVHTQGRYMGKHRWGKTMQSIKDWILDHFYTRNLLGLLLKWEMMVSVICVCVCGYGEVWWGLTFSNLSFQLCKRHPFLSRSNDILCWSDGVHVGFIFISKIWLPDMILFPTDCISL